MWPKLALTSSSSYLRLLCGGISGVHYQAWSIIIIVVVRNKGGTTGLNRSGTHYVNQAACLSASGVLALNVCEAIPSPPYYL